jgi:cytochrome b
MSAIQPPHRRLVWDLPLRLFHWGLVAACVAAFTTGKLGGNLIDWHGRIGLAVVGLVVFRIVWGFVGSPTARFANFVTGPAGIRDYLQGRWQGIGHNPLGALAVLGLLGLAALQAVSGLFSNDDIAFAGPLAPLVSPELSARITHLHGWIFNGLLALVALHVSAIAFYARVKKKNLVLPMITGYLPDDEPAQAATPPKAAFVRHVTAVSASLAIATGSVYLAAGAFLADPPALPVQTSSTPSW